jgi:hypothetical protein
MALADPQSFTTDSAKQLNRVVTGDTSATYLTSDGTLELFVSHQTPKGSRRTLVKSTLKKVSSDPLTDVKSEIQAQAYLTIVRPNVGFTEAELIQLATGLFTWNTTGTNANLKKVLGLES